MTERGRILPAKDIHRAAKEVVKKAKKKQGKPMFIVMNGEDYADVCLMLRRITTAVAGVKIRTLQTMPRGKLGIQWEEMTDEEDQALVQEARGETAGGGSD